MKSDKIRDADRKQQKVVDKAVRVVRQSLADALVWRKMKRLEEGERQKVLRLLCKDIEDEHMPELPSSGAIDDRRKRLLIYGRRAKTHVFLKYVPPPVDDSEQQDELPESDGNEEEEEAIEADADENEDAKGDGEDAMRGAQAPEDEEEESFMNKLVIDADNPVKSYFDVIILLFVGYSCIQSLYTVAFSQPTAPFFLVWDWVVEGMFYSDLVLNFFHAYIDEETQTVVNDWNMIYKRYLGSWFIIDFVSVFPF
jgi:hypothetical protein